MEQKTKLDFFIEAYTSFGLFKEAKDVVASHAQYMTASAKLKAAIAKHFQSYMAETFASVKFNLALPCHANVKRANAFLNFANKVETLIKIKKDKVTTLKSRKAKLSSEYSSKLAKSVASNLVLRINGLLNEFEKASVNLTFKPTRDFYDTLADVRETLTQYDFKKRELWQGFTMPDTRLLIPEQSTPIIKWLLTGSYKAVSLCFTTLAKFEKSSAIDKVEEFDQLINKLETSLCKRLHDDLAGKLVTSLSQEPSLNWLDSVDIRHVVKGEYVVAEIGAENAPIKLLNAREELSRELAETDVRLSYSLESEECRVGIFAAIKGMTKELESGLANAVDKTDFLIGFFNSRRSDYLQAYLDKAISAAIKGKGSADKSHLNDLNSLLISYSVMASPNNGESRIMGVLGASELVHYIRFVCPWLNYKANDGGWVESTKWEGLATAHKGNGFPTVGKDGVCLYPLISLMRYMTVKKTIQTQVRITNKARKRHNENIAKSGK